MTEFFGWSRPLQKSPPSTEAAETEGGSADNARHGDDGSLHIGGSVTKAGAQLMSQRLSLMSQRLKVAVLAMLDMVTMVHYTAAAL
jgi:hypothetical protein